MSGWGWCGVARRRAGRGVATDIIAGVLVLLVIIGLVGGVYYYKARQAELAEKGVEIHIVARQWVFEPSEIVVRKGQVVKLIITSRDVVHGFMIEALNINVVVEPGKPTIVIFKADKPGVYEFRCSVYCGEPWPGSGMGHWLMRGVIKVVEA
jgi:cytochrome c oxidase subunit 2